MARKLLNHDLTVGAEDGTEHKFGPGTVLPKWVEPLVSYDVTEHTDEEPGEDTRADSSAGSSSAEPKPVDDMSADELRAEYQKLTGEKAHHALSEDNLRTKVTEARESAGGAHS